MDAVEVFPLLRGVGEGAGGKKGHAVAEPGGVGEQGLEPPHRAGDLGHLGVEPHVDGGVILDPAYGCGHQAAGVFAPPGVGEVEGVAAQPVLPLHQGHREALVGQGQGRGHPGHAAPHHQGPLLHRHGVGRQGAVARHLCHGHADQVLGLLRGPLRLVHVDPGVLVPDVGHLEEALVEPGLPHGLLEEGFVGPWGAGGHHHPVEPLLLYGGGHLLDGVLGAGEEVVLDEGHPREPPGVLRHLLHVHHPGDVDAAVADEDPDPGGLGIDVPFRRKLPGLGLAPAGGGQEGLGLRRRAAGLHHRLGDVLGARGGAADEDAWPGGGEGLQGGHREKTVGGGVHPHPVEELHVFWVHLQAHREDHHVEGLLHHLALGITIAEGQAPLAGGEHRVDPSPVE